MEFLDISSIDGSENSVYNSIESHGREILIITISIGNGKTDELTIREHDTPKFIAKEFCRKHKLNPEAEKVIVEVIKDHLRVRPVVETSKLGENSEKAEKSLKSEPFQSKPDQTSSKPVPFPSKQDPFSSKPFEPGEKSFKDSEKRPEKENREGRSRLERNSMDFTNFSRNSLRRNTGERLYNEALLHKEQYEKKISDIREKIQKDLMKETTFKPSITQEKKMERLSLISSDEPQGKNLDRCHVLYNKSRNSLSNQGTPEKFLSSSPNFSQKVLNSRKHLQHYLDLKEQGRKSNSRFRSPGLATRTVKKRVNRSQSNDRKVKLSNEQTDKIINRIKTIRFVQLFENLNPNDRQEINKVTVQSLKLPKVIQRILKPFLDELVLLNLDLNLEHFCRVMELYLRDLTPEERSTLLQIGKKKTSQNMKKNLTLNRDMVNDLWSPKHEEKLLAFEQMPECT
jgi:hypothetical protein